MHIKIDLKIFVFAIIFLITKNIGMYALLMIFALAHELGHLFAGLILKFRPKELSIMPYGFNIKFAINYTDYNKKIKKANMLSVKKIIIAFAGPITNLLIAIILFILDLNNININLIGFDNEYIIYSNIIIAAFNLIPIYPLDGGRIVKEIIHIFKGLKQSYIQIQDISWISIAILSAISSILILYYKNIVILIVIIYLWVLVIKTQKEFNMRINVHNEIEKNKSLHKNT